MIGIITLYYKNYNIGGLLQAYALQQVLKNENIECEQICVWHYKKDENISILKKVISKFKRIIKHPYRELNITIDNRDVKKRRKKIENELKGREQLMEQFMLQIPHSKEIYDFRNIKESLRVYDGFIVGSDQVWNDDYISKDFMEINTLSFVPNTYLKMSYAASFGKSDNFKSCFGSCLENIKCFNAVSVREKTAQTILEHEGINATVVLDPTLLLERKYWDRFVEKDKLKIKVPYIFTYFLGKDKRNREFACEIAAETGYSILNFAHAINFFRNEDENYGDYKIMEYSPEDFVNYIASAGMILTDSFHATVFSIIFHKDFYVFSRGNDSGIVSMNSRLEDLLKQYDLEYRLIKENQADRCDMKKFRTEIDYEKIDAKIAEQRKSSKRFLFSQLKLT